MSNFSKKSISSSPRSRIDSDLNFIRSATAHSNIFHSVSEFFSQNQLSYVEALKELEFPNFSQSLRELSEVDLSGRLKEVEELRIFVSTNKMFLKSVSSVFDTFPCEEMITNEPSLNRTVANSNNLTTPSEVWSTEAKVHLLQMGNSEYEVLDEPLLRSGSIYTKSSKNKSEIADTVLIFFCDPDTAEAVVGDLMENYGKVRGRKSKLLSELWFYWELVIIVATRAKARLIKAVVPTSIWQAILKRIGG